MPLGVAITTASGRVYRWAEDEPDPRRRPKNMSWTTVMPGGFQTFSCDLPRRPDEAAPDLNPFDDVRVYDRGGNRTVWEGRAAQFPGSFSGPTVRMGAVGWQASLTDDPGFRRIYIDRDLAQWSGPSDERRISIIDNDKSAGDVLLTTAMKKGQPSLALVATTPWETTGAPDVEAWFDAGSGLALKAVYFVLRLKRIAGMNFKSGFATDDDAIAESNSHGAGSYTETTTDDSRRFAVFQWTQGGADSADGITREAHCRDVAVYGDTQLYPAMLQDDEPERGYFASDIIADMLRESAPDLAFSTGPDGTIRPSQFVVPHASWPAPTSLADAIQDVNVYDLFEWAVWDNRTFHYRPIEPDRLTWTTSTSDWGDKGDLDLEGPQADDLYNGVVVSYRLPNGEERTIGPTSAERMSDTDDLLEDTNPDNALNAHNMRRWGLIRLETPMTKKGALQIGQLWLIEHSRPQRRGSVVIPQRVRHPNGGWDDAYMVRAGDHLKITDLRGGGAAVPRRIVETTYNQDDQTITCTLDSSPHLIDAILSRLAIDYVGLVQG